MVSGLEHWKFLCATTDHRKWFTYVPCAADCVDLLTEFCCAVRYCVDKVVVDNGTTFRAEEFVELTRQLGARIEYGGTYAHWNNGKIERFHRCFNERVRCAIYDRTKDKFQEIQGYGWNIDTVAVEASEVERIARKVITMWNATDRARRPHSLTHRPRPIWV